MVASDKFIGDLRARFEAAGIWEDMTLVLSSDNGYKGPETHIKRDPENRIVSRLSPSLVAHLKEMSSGNAQMPFVFAQRCKGSLPWMQNRPPTLHAIFKPLQRPDRPICAGRLRSLGRNVSGRAVLRIQTDSCENSSASANMTLRPRARSPI